MQVGSQRSRRWLTPVVVIGGVAAVVGLSMGVPAAGCGGSAPAAGARASTAVSKKALEVEAAAAECSKDAKNCAALDELLANAAPASEPAERVGVCSNRVVAVPNHQLVNFNGSGSGSGVFVLADGSLSVISADGQWKVWGTSLVPQYYGATLNLLPYNVSFQHPYGVTAPQPACSVNAGGALVCLYSDVAGPVTVSTPRHIATVVSVGRVGQGALAGCNFCRFVATGSVGGSFICNAGRPADANPIERAVQPSVVEVSSERTHCTGLLVSPSQVAVSSHCVAEQAPEQLTVTAGSTRSAVTSITSHPEARPDDAQHAMAVITLADALSLSEELAVARFAAEPVALGSTLSLVRSLKGQTTLIEGTLTSDAEKADDVGPFALQLEGAIDDADGVVMTADGLVVALVGQLTHAARAELAPLAGSTWLAEQTGTETGRLATVDATPDDEERPVERTLSADDLTAAQDACAAGDTSACAIAKSTAAAAFVESARLACPKAVSVLCSTNGVITGLNFTHAITGVTYNLKFATSAYVSTVLSPMLSNGLTINRIYPINDGPNPCHEGSSISSPLMLNTTGNNLTSYGQNWSNGHQMVNLTCAYGPYGVSFNRSIPFTDTCFNQTTPINYLNPMLVCGH